MGAHEPVWEMLVGAEQKMTDFMCDGAAQQDAWFDAKSSGGRVDVIDEHGRQPIGRLR